MIELLVTVALCLIVFLIFNVLCWFLTSISLLITGSDAYLFDHTSGFYGALVGLLISLWFISLASTPFVNYIIFVLLGFANTWVIVNNLEKINNWIINWGNL